MSLGQRGLWGRPQANPDQFAPQATVFTDEVWVVKGPALEVDFDNSQSFSFYSWQGSATAVGNGGQLSCALRAGLYNFSVLGISGPARGTLNWYLDDELVVSHQDWYTATTTYKVIQTSKVTVRRSGAHLLRYEHVARNPSSTSDRVTLTKLWFWPDKMEVQEVSR